jgi:hypothetical protein
MRSVHEVGLLCKFQALTAASGCLGTSHLSSNLDKLRRFDESCSAAHPRLLRACA